MGEFVRLCLEIDKWKVGDPIEPREVNKKRVSELLTANLKEWTRPISRDFEYVHYTRQGMPYALARPLSPADMEFLDRGDGWLATMSPRLFFMFNFICERHTIRAKLLHPFMRRVHFARFFIPEGHSSEPDYVAREIAGATVLSRCLSVEVRVRTFSAVTDETWAMLAERFKDGGSYLVDSYAGDMPASEFRGGRYQPHDPYGVVESSYRFNELHPSAVPTWVRQFRRLTEEELNAPECRDRRKKAGVLWS
jgi:hypothetical protein